MGRAKFQTFTEIQHQNRIRTIIENGKKTFIELLDSNRRRFNLTDARHEQLVQESQEFGGTEFDESGLMTTMMRELLALKLYDRDEPYDKARILLYSGLLEGDVRKIKEAGELLHEIKGVDGMTDSLLWSVVPKSLQRKVDLIWDGVGEWRC